MPLSAIKQEGAAEQQAAVKFEPEEERAEGRRKREAERADDTYEQAAKRARTVVNDVAEEWLCPITRELPVDPVLAEDGKIYERAAVEKWCREHKRSPSTGSAMGTRLVASPQVRNSLEKLVQSGLVDPDKASSWKKKMEDEEFVKELRAKAEQGDADAMYLLGTFSSFGTRGILRDREKGRAWYKRATELGHVEGMACLGQSLLKGLGGPPSPTEGLVYTAQAAGRGSELATYLLGKAHMEGSYGLTQDHVQAKRLLRKVVEGQCIFKDLKEASQETAEQFLQQLD